MTLYDLQPRFQALLRPAVRALHAAGVTANQVTVAACAVAVALAAALWWITPVALWEAGLMALAITLLGFLGGLAMSAIKRDRG